MPTVTDIARCHGAPRARHVVIDDMPWRVLPIAVLKELGIKPGDDVAFAVIEDLVDDAEPRLGRARALALIGYRERCAAEVSSKLADEGYSSAVVSRIVEDLQTIQLIDDARFAEARARTLLQIRGLGRTRALREMTACGLDRELALQALDGCAPPEDEHERAALAAHRVARPADSVNSLAQRLVRKGYGVSTSLQAARECIDARSDNGNEPQWTDRDVHEDAPECPDE